MSDPTISRRTLLRAAAIAGLGALAGCGRTDPQPPSTLPPAGTTDPTPPVPSATPSPSTLWRAIDAKLPPARRDHTFTGDPRTGRAYLFGGRSDGAPRGDLYVYDPAKGWSAARGAGPAPRFGHNAEIVGDRLVLFGGQAGSTFFDDVWSLDLTSLAWKREAASAPRPSKRYGAGSAVVAGRLWVSHGFTNTGRFDDTWSWSGTWRNDSTGRGGSRPVKRCLHRTAWWPEASRVALFGGQTDGTPFLRDLWLYDPSARTWTQTKQTSPPSARNLSAMFAAAGRLWLFGGNTASGPTASLHAATPGGAWTTIAPTAGIAAPSARHGIEAAVVGERRALIFGGRGEDGDLADLWELNLPA